MVVPPQLPQLCQAHLVRERGAEAPAQLNFKVLPRTKKKIKQLAARDDITLLEMFDRMLELYEREYGKLNILFNNAGIVKQGRVEDSTTEDWNAQIATTLTSVFLGCKYGIPLIRAQGGGIIISPAPPSGPCDHTTRRGFCVTPEITRFAPAFARSRSIVAASTPSDFRNSASVEGTPAKA